MFCFFIFYLLRFCLLPHSLDVEHFFCYFSDKDLQYSSAVWHLHACREWTDCWVKYVCSCSKTDLRSEEDVLCNCTFLSGQEIFIYLFPRNATTDFNGVKTEQGMAVLVLHKKHNVNFFISIKEFGCIMLELILGIAWKLREFLLVWNKGHVSII